MKAKGFRFRFPRLRYEPKNYQLTYEVEVVKILDYLLTPSIDCGLLILIDTDDGEIPSLSMKEECHEYVRNEFDQYMYRKGIDRKSRKTLTDLTMTSIAELLILYNARISIYEAKFIFLGNSHDNNVALYNLSFLVYILSKLLKLKGITLPSRLSRELKWYNSPMQNPEKELTILSIDTSCDETSVAVTRGFTILSNLLPSQMEYHREFGGVVPSLAKLAHQERIDNVVEKSMRRARVEFKDIDAIAVTYGPGLAMALEIGINKAKELAQQYSKPLVLINHMEGHLLSSLARRQVRNSTLDALNSPITLLPVLGFLISGGHTELVFMKEFGDYEKVGETVDDSCGEAYDKCGRMLGLGYPAGPVISKFADEHRDNTQLSTFKNNNSTLVKIINKETRAEYILPIAMANSGDLNFSFSGLKTAFNNLVSKLRRENSENELTKLQILDLCVAFEAAALEQLAIKLKSAIQKYNPKEIWLGGGVVASTQLRNILRKTAGSNIKVKYPFAKNLTGDNAAMIGIAANLKAGRVGLTHNPESDIYLKNLGSIERDPSLSF